MSVGRTRATYFHLICFQKGVDTVHGLLQSIRGILQHRINVFLWPPPLAVERKALSSRRTGSSTLLAAHSSLSREVIAERILVSTFHRLNSPRATLKAPTTGAGRKDGLEPRNYFYPLSRHDSFNSSCEHVARQTHRGVTNDRKANAVTLTSSSKWQKTKSANAEAQVQDQNRQQHHKASAELLLQLNCPSHAGQAPGIVTQAQPEKAELPEAGGERGPD